MTHNEISKLNILYFAPCGLQEGVGGSARLRNMIDVLGQLGANIELISYLPGEKFGVALEQMNSSLNTTTISVRRLAPKVLKLFALWLVLIYGLRHIRKKNLIFAHSPAVTAGFPALVLAKIFRKPLFIDHMDVKDPETPVFIYDYVLRNSDVVFAISRFLEKEIEELGSSDVVYLPIFLDASVFQRDDLARAKIREKLGISHEDILIGYAGSFSHIEGVPFLLQAFKRLSIKHENIKLVVVGGRNVAGSDNVAWLMNELGINERAILIPSQPHALMPEYLSAFDIACSPKIDCPENRAANPIKIYEYMSMGLPMVVSAVGEPASVIENGVDGFLVKPGDQDELERILEYVMQNLDIAKRAGEKAREKVIRTYTQQEARKRIEGALKQMTGMQASK